MMGPTAYERLTIAYLTYICFVFVPITALNITILTYGISKESANTNSMAYVAPPVQLGVQELENVYGFNVNHTILTDRNIQTCDDELIYADLVSKFYYSQTLDSTRLFVIIFAGCDSALQLSRLSREWNTLMISSGATLSEIRNKTLHPTAVSMTSVSYQIYLQSMLFMIEKYNWSSVAYIYDTTPKSTFYQQLALEIQLRMVSSIGNLNILTFPTNSLEVNISYTQLLRQASLISRVVILGFHATFIRTFMITAASLGMTDHSYVYIAIEAFPSLRRFGDLVLLLNDSYDQVVLDSYHQMFQLSICNAQNKSYVSKIQRKIKNLSIQEYNASFLPTEQTSEIALMAYVAVKVFAQVLNETFHSKDSVYDAATMAKRFQNRTFSLDIGPVYMDSTGERLPDYCFKRLFRETNTFEDVLYYNPASKILASTNNSIIWSTPTKQPPPNTPVCGFSGKTGPCDSGVSTFLFGFIPVIFIVIGICVVVTLMLKRSSMRFDEWWRIDEKKLQQVNITQSHADMHFTNLQFLCGVPVATTVLRLEKAFIPNKATRTALSEVRKLTHDNIVTFLGLCPVSGKLIVVHENSEKGDLFDVLAKLQLDWNDRLSLLSDLIEGINAVHGSFFKRHGYISPYTLFINKRLTLQIGDVGIYDILCNVDFTCETEKAQSVSEVYGSWTAPELKMFLDYLDTRYLVARYAGPEADIYSFGAVLMFMRSDCQEPLLSKQDTAFLLAAPCLHEIPAERPAITTVRKTFREYFSSTRGIAQNLIMRMQNYAEKLESAVKDRTRALLDERQLCEELLAEMLPSSVVTTLLKGITVEAQKFDCVTVLFSYITGFFEFVSQRIESPEKVVAFLNLVFSTFDQLLYHRDIYKVETISDTYMVVSGLPVPNGNLHAPEVCRLSVQLQHSFVGLTELHRLPSLHVTVGINSGPCAAGVIGNKRPRYCLFGDTVNIASRLATQGAPSKTHISGTTAFLITNYTDLRTVVRGEVYLKGKGNEITYWLTT